MPRFTFSKLVRDDIVAQQIAGGVQPTYHHLTSEAHKQELIKKIIEEAREISDAPADEVAAELADVQQALDDLATLCGITQQDISVAQSKKAQQRGTFSKGIYIDSILVDEAYEWTSYYRAHPNRYPEL